LSANIQIIREIIAEQNRQ